MNTEQVRIGGKCRGAGSEYEIMTTAVQRYLLGRKSEIIIDKVEVFFPVESHCDQCNGEERFILQAGHKKQVSKVGFFFKNAAKKRQKNPAFEYI